MKVFGDYAKYYDLIYQDKDYSAEAKFINGLINQYSHCPPQKLLELGSGTGRHAYHLAKQGYTILGVDQSALMLEMAGNFLAKDSAVAPKVSLQQGDIRRLNLDQQFDSAISLFHVLSYQTTNSDLEATFNTVKKHVTPGGLFIFDCWYGPAVLSQMPEVRYKTICDPQLNIARVATPTLFENENVVKIHYDIFIQQNDNSAYYKMEEDHFMRYLFYPEIEALCAKFGMTIKMSCEWLTHKPLSKQSWGACFVVQL